MTQGKHKHDEEEAATLPEATAPSAKRIKVDDTDNTNTTTNTTTITTTSVLQVKKLSEFAVIPARGSKQAAGYDLSSAYEYVVPAKGKELVKTDLCIAVPDGHYGRVAPRSGLAWKNFIDTGAGVIDSDYRGNVGVILFNHSDADFKVARGDRIAQLIIEKISTPEVVEVTEIDETERGAGGFGSTSVSGPVPKAV